MAAARVLRIVTGDPAMNDEALAAEVARSEDMHGVADRLPDHLKPTS